MKNELLEVVNYRKAHKAWTLTVAFSTVVAAVAGGFAGAMAFYNGWLG